MVSVAPDALLEGVASLDVNGSRFAGTNRVGLTVSANSPLGKGDSLTLSHLQTTTGGLDFTLLGYLLPVGADGFKAGVNVSQVNYNLSDADFPLGLEGDSDSISVFGLYPLVRSRNLNLFVLANHERKYFSDRLRLAATETRKVLTQNSFTLSGDFRDSLLGGAINTFELAYTDGEINYPQGRPAGLDDASLLRKTEWEYSRLQSLVPGRWLAYASLRGQAAGNNLDSSAQCTLGGSQAVRAFAQGEGSGDNCQIYTTELRYVLPWKVLNRSREGLYVAAFYDQGRVRLREDASARPTTFVNTQRLAGYGLALNWEVFDLLTWQISLGWPLEGEPASDPKKQEPRIYSVFRYYF
ncbi:MAG: ShlB/FhaC/HecB family hemolysin secretion/activation protein [Limnobacter sp.]|nr:ShlB/FhaC/HecB family hemolysin secretion/activation protein [Limnobacter sp.]